MLPVAAIYGANASGKSNVLAALASMTDAVTLSLRHWSPDEGIPQDPFAWGPKRMEPTRFEIEIALDGTRYRYGFEFNDLSFSERMALCLAEREETDLARTDWRYLLVRGESEGRK